MKTLQQIRADLAAEFPDNLTQEINGQTVTLSEQEKAAQLDTWAQGRYDSQAQAAEQAGSEAMSSARSAMAAILDALDMDDRMELQNLRVQVEAALNLGQVDLAYYIVTNAAIPAHLETVRTQILALFPQ